MRSRAWNFHYLFFELIIDLATFVIAMFLLVSVAKGQTATESRAATSLAPELFGGPWLNTPNGNPIPLTSRRGKVTIVHFWTFGCINCRNNLPAYAHWHKQFAERGVIVIGVHTPETEGERVTADVLRRVRQLGIEYPILLDQDETNWRRWQQQYWPTVYLIDKRGRIRFRWIGELNYGNRGGEVRVAQWIEELLQEPF